jgi:SAM-dependent methyltransferase
MMKQFWDERYSSEAYVYGKDSNDFFASQLEKVTPGKILLPGEGEGRNAVYAARKGWSVDAYDQSEAGRQKALFLAKERGVQINYQTCETEAFILRPDHYDFIALIFFHVDEVSRKNLHHQIYRTLKPGGRLILEAFHKEQLHKNTGGPKSPEMLYDESSLSLDFTRFETLLLEKRSVKLNEGPFHQGEASLIRFSGIKPQ